MLFYSVITKIFKIYTKTFYKVEIKGLENLPEECPYIKDNTVAYICSSQQITLGIFYHKSQQFAIKIGNYPQTPLLAIVQAKQ